MMAHPLLHATLSTSSQSLSSTSLALFSSTSPTPGLLSTHPLIHCEDPRQDGTSAEYHPLTGYEPKSIELNRTLLNQSHQEIDDQDDFEEIGVKPMSYSQSLIHSAYDSALQRHLELKPSCPGAPGPCSLASASRLTLCVLRLSLLLGMLIPAVGYACLRSSPARHWGGVARAPFTV